MPDLLVRALALVSGDVATIASELHKKRVLSSEKVRKLLGRDLVASDEAILASAETLIRYGAVQAATPGAGPSGDPGRPLGPAAPGPLAAGPSGGPFVE